MSYLPSLVKLQWWMLKSLQDWMKKPRNMSKGHKGDHHSSFCCKIIQSQGVIKLMVPLLYHTEIFALLLLLMLILLYYVLFSLYQYHNEAIMIIVCLLQQTLRLLFIHNIFEAPLWFRMANVKVGGRFCGISVYQVFLVKPPRNVYTLGIELCLKLWLYESGYNILQQKNLKGTSINNILWLYSKCINGASSPMKYMGRVDLLFHLT